MTNRSPKPEDVTIDVEARDVVEDDVKTFSWGEACDLILDGFKMGKISWGSAEIYLYLRANILHLRKADGTEHVLIVSSGDMSGQDYYIIEKPS